MRLFMEARARFHLITGSLQGGTTIDFGAGNEVFTLSVGASAASIAGGTGNDTFIVASSSCKPHRQSPVVQVMTPFPLAEICQVA